MGSDCDYSGHTLSLRKAAPGRRELETADLIEGASPEPTAEEYAKVARLLAGSAARANAPAEDLRDVLEALGVPNLRQAGSEAGQPTPWNAAENGPMPTVWVAGRNELAHWESDCPQRAGFAVCGSTSLRNGTPTPAAEIPPRRRCTSPACASRWGLFVEGVRPRLRCPRHRVYHSPEAA